MNNQLIDACEQFVVDVKLAIRLFDSIVDNRTVVEN